MPHPVPNLWDDAGCRLWPLIVHAASKGKLVPPADAEALLANQDLEAVDMACAALQQWCWVRGLPPIDRVIAHPRTKGEVRRVADYDVFFEAMGVVVNGERFVLAYPWSRVKEPSPAELAWARWVVAAHGVAVRAFRFLDLELDLREADAARGRRRPVPPGFDSWDSAAQRHKMLLAQLAENGILVSDLRPPGKAPYPPTPPRVATYSH